MALPYTNQRDCCTELPVADIFLCPNEACRKDFVVLDTSCDHKNARCCPHCQRELVQLKHELEKEEKLKQLVLRNQRLLHRYNQLNNIFHKIQHDCLLIQYTHENEKELENEREHELTYTPQNSQFPQTA